MWKRLIKNPKEFFYYLQGNIRYYLYTSKSIYLNNLVPKHIAEQYNLRISVMDRLCYKEGECTICGCETTKLQMADKACDKPCYPPMMDKALWEKFSIVYQLSLALYIDYYIGEKSKMVMEVYEYVTGASTYKLHKAARKILYQNLTANGVLYNK